jgi:hypothetical protein
VLVPAGYEEESLYYFVIPPFEASTTIIIKGLVSKPTSKEPPNSFIEITAAGVPTE